MQQLLTLLQFRSQGYAAAKRLRIDHPIPFQDEQIFEKAYQNRFKQHFKALERKRAAGGAGS